MGRKRSSGELQFCVQNKEKQYVTTPKTPDSQQNKTKHFGTKKFNADINVRLATVEAYSRTASFLG